MTNGAKNIVDRIKEEGIEPRPRWYFILVNAGKWSGFVIASLIGAVSFSVILYTFLQADFNPFSHLSHSGIELLLGLLPVFWMLMLFAFTLLAMVGLRSSEKGYRLTWVRLMVYCVIISVFLGSWFYLGGGAQWLDNAFAERVDSYESLLERKRKVWMNPAEGTLSGTIVRVNDRKTFELKGLDETHWIIDYSDAFVVPRIRVKPGIEVKMTGEMTAAGHFKTDKIRPWSGGRRQGMHRNQ